MLPLSLVQICGDVGSLAFSAGPLRPADRRSPIRYPAIRRWARGQMQFHQMKRREFITLLGATPAVCPIRLRLNCGHPSKTVSARFAKWFKS
jgi:hypothetical protein